MKRDKILNLLLEVRTGHLKSRANSVWSPLSRADLVLITHYPDTYKIKSVELTPGGEAYLKVFGRNVGS